MSLYARSKPYPTTPYGTYTCQRCGIIKAKRTGVTNCNDCRRYVKDKG